MTLTVERERGHGSDNQLLALSGFMSDLHAKLYVSWIQWNKKGPMLAWYWVLPSDFHKILYFVNRKEMALALLALLFLLIAIYFASNFVHPPCCNCIEIYFRERFRDSIWCCYSLLDTSNTESRSLGYLSSSQFLVISRLQQEENAEIFLLQTCT